jgi:glycosyltransferase involved in cell wall biosynthesis
MALISIIIPTYNSAYTINVCLASLASQTFRDFEIILVDGLSVDQTLSMITNFFSKNPDLSHVLISEKDDGIFDAMNKGARLARGQWLYFLGSDDWLYSSDTLSKVAGDLQQAHCEDFVYGNVWLDDTQEVYDGKFSLRTILKANICHQAIFVRKSLFEAIGPFDLNYPVHADWDFNVKVFLEKRPTRYKNLLVVQYSNKGYSSQHRDLQFEEKLTNIKAKYYEHFLHRLNSRYHYLKKRIKRLL